VLARSFLRSFFYLRLLLHKFSVYFKETLYAILCTPYVPHAPPISSLLYVTIMVIKSKRMRGVRHVAWLGWEEACAGFGGGT
jgi:hypothetical protein